MPARRTPRPAVRGQARRAWNHAITRSQTSTRHAPSLAYRMRRRSTKFFGESPGVGDRCGKQQVRGPYAGIRRKSLIEIEQAQRCLRVELRRRHTGSYRCDIQTTAVADFVVAVCQPDQWPLQDEPRASRQGQRSEHDQDHDDPARRTGRTAHGQGRIGRQCHARLCMPNKRSQFRLVASGDARGISVAQCGHACADFGQSCRLVADAPGVRAAADPANRFQGAGSRSAWWRRCCAGDAHAGT